VLRFTGGGSNRPPEPEDKPMLHRFRSEAARVLIATPIIAADGVSAWQKLRSIFAETKRTFAQASSVALQILLGPLPDVSHEYEFQSYTVGPGASVGLGAHGEAGIGVTKCWIRHYDRCAETPAQKATHGWPWTTYWGAVGHAAVGVMAGAEFEIELFSTSSSNDITASSEWMREDFVPSLLVSVGGSASLVAIPGVGVSVSPPQFLPMQSPNNGEAYVMFNRSCAVAVGWSTGWSATVGTGAGFGVAASLGVASMALFQKADTNVVPPAVPSQPERQLLASVNAVAAEGFAVDSADLLPHAMEHLQVTLARYRALFESPSSFIQIEGDASRTGSEPHNEPLSWQRALAVCSWIRSAFTAPPSGDWRTESIGLAVPDTRTYVVGYGEDRASDAGVADGIEDPAWRTIKLVVNNTLVVML
jgi:outer membrane protein OmpA-like peptidoglycan-associated protein